MLIIQKLYIKDFFKVLLILGAGISAIFSIIGLIDKIDDFMPHNPSFSLLLQYSLLIIPKYLHYLLPMLILLSSLFIFSQASKRREIVAIKAASGKLRSILKPFVTIGILLTLFGFVIGEVVVPAASKKARDTRSKITKKEKGITFKEGTLYMRGRDGSIVRISLYMPEKKISSGITIFRFDSKGLKDKMEAEVGEWQGNVWKLKNVLIYDIESGKTERINETIYTGIESPDILQKDMWKAEDLTIPELIQYQRRLTEAGFKNIKLTVDVNSRLSYPLINFFMLLLGISLSAGVDSISKKGKTAGGIVAGGLGILISIIYWISYTFFLSLGYAGTIPPFIAPWIMPVLFSAGSLYLYNQIPE